MIFRAEIRMDNAAFEDLPGEELARILRTVANMAGQVGTDLDMICMDYNGNKVGFAVVDSESDDAE